MSENLSQHFENGDMEPGETIDNWEPRIFIEPLTQQEKEDWVNAKKNERPWPPEEWKERWSKEK